MSNKNLTRIILFIISLFLCVGSCLLIDDAKIFLGLVLFIWGSNIATAAGKL